MQTTTALLVVVLGLLSECSLFIWFVARYVQKNEGLKVKISLAPLYISIELAMVKTVENDTTVTKTQIEIIDDNRRDGGI